MKKKVVTLCLVLALAAIAIAGGTIAYFTDTDSADNTFTVGNVKIDLIEQQRNDTGTGLEPFENGKTLAPIVGSAQGEKDEFGQPVAENYVDKMITIKNTGSQDAYIRAYFAIPSALDDGYEKFNPSMNVLHFNFGNKVVDDKLVSTMGTDWDWNTAAGKWNYFETTMDGIKYNVYFADYKTVVAAGDTTTQLVSGVYLDASFDMRDDKCYAFGKEVVLDAGWKWDAVKCPVFAVGVQAAGFDNPDAAFDKALGANYNPWGTEATNWQ